MTFEGKRILITGGGSGIGLELARRLAGTNEVVIAGRDHAKLEQARAATPALRTLRLDVTSEEEARRAFAWLASELGGLDVLVNNAGVFRGDIVEVNVIGAIRMTQLALPLLEESPEAAVLFMSSAVALTAVPGNAVYAASKAALHSLARSLRAELRGRGIRVVEVLPPVVDTEFASNLDVPKISAAAVADAIVAGVARDRDEIRIARVKQLAVLARVAPGLADRIVLRALTPPVREARRR
jgi:short-subunit dehydrogenase involved in D-alanine esterification of teichoic acids